MRCLLFALVLALPMPALAGPKKGVVGKFLPLPSGSASSPAEKDFPEQVTFVAGQRACVVITGRDESAPPDARFSVQILDEKNNVVATDGDANNLVAIWYPNREMTVTIRVRNHDSHAQRVFVSIK